MFSQCKEVIAHGTMFVMLTLELNRVGLLLARSKFVISAAKMSQKADNMCFLMFFRQFPGINKQICADFQDNAESNRLCTAE